jgi:hypothetical protein
VDSDSFVIRGVSRLRSWDHDLTISDYDEAKFQRI